MISEGWKPVAKDRLVPPGDFAIVQSRQHPSNFWIPSASSPFPSSVPLLRNFAL
ncbi:hypothetical protein CCM_02790 [Cordyceps militaris CM01]|uniref:Uncharacterized protein n=1 Tax=Cordyceps militaris (strain CM01) TaxID=983644 RepID=G3JBU6_CORMM|nr:uncharacterized protein CCM_02790 [Cordyceps militaris CM01]EGX94519.1 hypothetical protein CCM_02790 [Cordyceps militaris CM01]